MKSVINGRKKRLSRAVGIAMINLSREDALLVHCARLTISEEQRHAIKGLLTGKLDWDLLMQKAVWHRLPLLLSHHLSSPDLSMFVPVPVQERLKNLRYQRLARNMILQDELSHLLSIFNSQGIPTIVLKGAALLENIYADISLRSMNDLDILVRPEHLDFAEAIALGRGYVYLAAQNTTEKARKNGRHLDNLVLPGKGILLEIHQHFVNADDPYHFDLSGFWSRTEPVKILGVPALALAPGDLLIHLSIKFLLDRRYRSNNALGQLCDISEVIRHYDDSLDWDLIEKTCGEKGVSRGLHFVLYTCKHLLQAPIPGPILDRFQPHTFDVTSAEMFIRRRVLDSRPWLAHGLLDSQEAFNRRGTAWAIARRFTVFMRQIMSKNGKGSGPSGWRRIIDVLPKLGRVLFRPDELKKDLHLDRWLHDLYNAS
jgi:hypothetical protein